MGELAHKCTLRSELEFPCLKIAKNSYTLSMHFKVHTQTINSTKTKVTATAILNTSAYIVNNKYKPYILVLLHLNTRTTTLSNTKRTSTNPPGVHISCDHPRIVQSHYLPLYPPYSEPTTTTTNTPYTEPSTKYPPECIPNVYGEPT